MGCIFSYFFGENPRFYLAKGKRGILFVGVAVVTIVQVSNREVSGSGGKSGVEVVSFVTERVKGKNKEEEEIMSGSEIRRKKKRKLLKQYRQNNLWEIRRKCFIYR